MNLSILLCTAKFLLFCNCTSKHFLPMVTSLLPNKLQTNISKSIRSRAHLWTWPTRRDCHTSVIPNRRCFILIFWIWCKSSKHCNWNLCRLMYILLWKTELCRKWNDYKIQVIHFENGFAHALDFWLHQ